MHEAGILEAITPGKRRRSPSDTSPIPDRPAKSIKIPTRLPTTPETTIGDTRTRTPSPTPSRSSDVAYLSPRPNNSLNETAYFTPEPDPVPQDPLRVIIHSNVIVHSYQRATRHQTVTPTPPNNKRKSLAQHPTTPLQTAPGSLTSRNLYPRAPNSQSSSIRSGETCPSLKSSCGKL